MRSFCSLTVLFSTFLAGLSADTLILRNGQTIEGRYLSSDGRNIQFEVNGKPFTYGAWLVRELRFSRRQTTQPEGPVAGLHGKEQQHAFCQILRDFVQERQRLTSEPNPIRRAGMHPPNPWEFEPRIAAVFGPSGEFTDWTGRLFFTVSGSAVSINFAPACPPGLPTVTFTNGYPSDHRRAATQARIDLSSSLAQQLSREKTGSECRVSGYLFLRSEEAVGGFRPAVPTTSIDSRQRLEGAQPGSIANVMNPQYLARFSQIQSLIH
jgi:hypothetical protein